jgi:cytochrome c oxidase subunit I
MAAVSYLLTRYSAPSVRISWIAYVGTIGGIGLLAISTLVGLFGTGWYFLYPLPLYSSGVWPGWATGCFFSALALLGLVWTIWTLDLLRAIARRYKLAHALGWHVLSGRGEPQVPPLIVISTVSLIAAAAGFVAAVIVLILYGAEWLVQGFSNDALLMKNLTFFFGHIIANITMYLGVAVVYELFPAYAGRPWRTTKFTVLAWNAVMLLVLLAYFHHLYMDFAQPRSIQDAGQVASYFLSVPAAVVSIFSGLALTHSSKMRWTLASWLFFLGLMGWGIGGVAAVIDSTVAVNVRFHNTLWVPAHFHTYYLMGVVLMLLGFASHLGVELSRWPESPAMRRAILWLSVVGGYGFLAMFYWAGVNSVPRRYATYPSELSQGVVYARVAVGFITLILIAALLYLWDVGKRYKKAFSA